MFKQTLLASAFCSLALFPAAHAAHIEVVNENNKTIDLKIEAEGDSGAFAKHQISAQRESSFEVTSGQLNGKSHFSLKGDTNTFTPGGKCDHLSIDKDYKVTFLNDKVGTTCLAEEATLTEDKAN